MMHTVPFVLSLTTLVSLLLADTCTDELPGFLFRAFIIDASPLPLFPNIS